MVEQNWVSVLLLVLCGATLILSVLLLVLFVRQRIQVTRLYQRFTNLEDSLEKIEEIKELLQVLQDNQSAIHEKDDDTVVRLAEEVGENTPDEQFREKVLAAIASNYTNPSYTPARLIEDMCMSRSLFHRKSTALLGQSAGRLISAYRMEKAREMILANRDMNISDVAYAVGFNDPKYFTRFFTKFYGCSPSKISEETH